MSCFYLLISGQLESAYFPIGISSGSIYCRYEIVHGPDWELLSGPKSGITQRASVGNENFHTFVFNMPLEFTFKSTNPHGWPQIVFNLYGDNFWGTEVSRGNSRVHFPLAGADQSREILCPLVNPKPLDFCSMVAGWFSDWNPEFRDITVLTQGNKVKGINTESYGHVVLRLSAISRGQRALGLQWK